MSKAWLVTGRAGGIGAGVARAALRGDHRVVATDLVLERIERAYGSHCAQALRVKLDVRDPDDAEDALGATLAPLRAA